MQQEIQVAKLKTGIIKVAIIRGSEPAINSEVMVNKMKTRLSTIKKKIEHIVLKSEIEL